MTKETRKREKAVEKIRKAIRKAVDKGVSQTGVESAVEQAMSKSAKKVQAKDSATKMDDDPATEVATSRPAKAQLKKLPGKRKPPTLTLKRGKSS